MNGWWLPLRWSALAAAVADGDSRRAPAFAGAAPEECAESIVLARRSQAIVYPLLNFI